jgi:hypothetical protein
MDGWLRQVAAGGAGVCVWVRVWSVREGRCLAAAAAAAAFDTHTQSCAPSKCGVAHPCCCCDGLHRHRGWLCAPHAATCTTWACTLAVCNAPVKPYIHPYRPLHKGGLLHRLVRPIQRPTFSPTLARPSTPSHTLTSQKRAFLSQKSLKKDLKDDARAFPFWHVLLAGVRIPPLQEALIASAC